ncbi:glycosyltransferase family 4 protein [Rhodohalobacter mucosus]|uniref:Glycosyl transferase family 1 n=1 Tax=Rhodohalobacter mucosus TaxID=2079485 RepID=A0A316TW89_9BACT|nr:glycosyltransferase family 4 protein [Rhodohalobacter mucosus]PWN07465.1 glycosyl transferase family 1 [Rhodohalobacter mucosus]
MTVLINTTPPTNSGGVANHYKGLKEYWTEEVHYNYIGGRKNVPGSIIIWYDLIKLIWKLIAIKPDLVLLNPSLRKGAIKRDGLFLRVSKIFGKNTVVFFHGWNQELAKEISNSPYKFIKLFNKADKILVLASAFKEQLKDWGITKPISLTTTKVDDELVSQFVITEKKYTKTILFLARIEKAKGIFIALDAFKTIKEVVTDARMIIAGNGNALNEAKNYVKSSKLRDINFTGYLREEELIQTYIQSDLYILPTYGEGMPTSVLEAMSFGLPVISRPVGGMVDFFENGKMGYLVNSFSPEDFAKRVIEILLEKEKHQATGRYNFQYAKEHFYASHVAREMEKHFYEVVTL